MKVSIVMPIYNSGKTLEVALTSVFRQRNKNYELIVVDGGSTDNTMDIVNRYRDRIDIFISEKDRGYADALNKGIKASTGDFYLMLAADDYLLDNAVDSILGEVHNDADAWCGNMYCLKELNIITRFKRVDSIDDVTKGKVIAHPATAFRVSSFDKFGWYDLDFPVNADRELILRWHRNGARFQMSNKYITVFSCSGMSTEVAKKIKLNDSTTFGEKVSIMYGQSPQEAHSQQFRATLRRRIGKVIKNTIKTNKALMIFLYSLDGQKPLSNKQVRTLNIDDYMNMKR